MLLSFVVSYSDVFQDGLVYKKAMKLDAHYYSKKKVHYTAIRLSKTTDTTCIVVITLFVLSYQCYPITITSEAFIVTHHPHKGCQHFFFQCVEFWVFKIPSDSNVLLYNTSYRNPFPIIRQLKC